MLYKGICKYTKKKQAGLLSVLREGLLPQASSNLSVVALRVVACGCRSKNLGRHMGAGLLQPKATKEKLCI